MTPRHFVQNGKHETLKGLVHATAAGLCWVCAVYNGVAWCYRRDRHLRWNAIVYTLAFGWEVEQAMRHFRDQRQVYAKTNHERRSSGGSTGA